VGVVGVLGNHDWYGDGVAMQAALDRVGVRMLRNQRLWLDGQRRLSTSPLPDAMVIAGLADLSEDRVDVRAALGGLKDAVPRIVLAHQPDTAEMPELAGPDGPRVDLMLSGHTHGGQVRIPFLGTPGIPSNYGQKYAGGLIAGPRFPVLVSRGVGMSVLPVRVGVPPEIGLITLRRG
jgi:predicted MPP superfamily phosphohydrolase